MKSRSLSVQVLPSQLNEATVLIRETDPWFGYFINMDIEREFQMYYRREKQSKLPLKMFTIIVISITATVGGFQSVSDISASFANMTHTSSMTFQSAKRPQWYSHSCFLTLVILFPILSLGCIVFVLKYHHTAFLTKFRIDPIQIVLLVFYQFTYMPVVITIAAWIQVQLSYINDVDDGTSANHLIKSVLVILGISFIDYLYFFLLLGSSMASCLLRLQFGYFMILALEFAIITIALSSTYFPYITERWRLFGVFICTLVFVARGAWEHELSCRREFLSSIKLVSENRRLSNQNIEMKEELSGKLNYQLHYEMGDILRILCQIKLKMTPREKQDIDKIITALITNDDLFEVTLDPSMAEHEEEVQGWLHMMAFKDSAVPSANISNTNLMNHNSRTKTIMPKAKFLKTASSRKLIRHVQNELKAAETITQFFMNEMMEERDELSKWLLESLRNDFFVDMFYIDRHCKSPMQAVLITCVEINDFGSRLALDMKKLTAFASAVENHYFKQNPYHNRLHAGAVVADIHFYLRRLNLNVDDTTFFVGLIAAAAHDISHPGVSNGYLIASKSKLAITYSDDTVLERMHIAELYRILSHDKFDIFSHMSDATRLEIRKLIIQMILATDLSRHFAHISKLKSRKFAVNDAQRGLEVALIMETLIMLADLGHTVKPFSYHQTWANLIAEEFFRQGEAEERQNLPISPLCDRKLANLPKSQVTFLTLLATPLFQTTHDSIVIEEFDIVMDALDSNIKTWQGMIGSTESGDISGQRSPRPEMTKTEVRSTNSPSQKVWLFKGRSDLLSTQSSTEED